MLDGTPTLVATASGLGTRWSFSSGVTHTLPGRQTVRAGVELIDNLKQNQYGRYLGSTDAILDTDRSSWQNALYVQDEIKLGRRIIVNVGLRYDDYEKFSRVTPRAALSVLPSSSQSFKYLYGRAFRAPNENELNVVYFGPDVLSLQPESIDTHEVVWERYPNDRLRTAVSAYWYNADRLITPAFDDGAFLGVSFVNQGKVRAKGVELEGQWRLKGEARTLLSYALQTAVDQQTGAGLANSPRHIAKARISLPVPGRGSFVSVEGQYLSRRTTVAGPPVSAATTVSVHIVCPIGRSWELFGGVRDAFNVKYADPVSAQHKQDAIEQNGRTARVGLRWKFWNP